VYTTLLENVEGGRGRERERERERENLKPHTSSTSKSEEMHVVRFTLHSL